MLEWLRPDWPAPPRVRAASTTRWGGVSAAPWASLNLADHVGDVPSAVAENRRRLRVELALPAEPRWLTQVHGCRVVGDAWRRGCEADAAVAERPGQVCAVLTADCLPVLLCNRRGNRIAAVHAGWRGLAAGVLEAALERFSDPPTELLAWLGPAIGPEAFEVGAEVRAAFCDGDPGAAQAFAQYGDGKWLADLCGLARRRLSRYGVSTVCGGGWCTYTEPARFFSYRRDGVTGRMATLIWLQGPDDAR